MIANAGSIALKPTKALVRKRPFDREGALAFAREALSLPCPNPLVERVELRGYLVAEFVLPLELCPTGNQVAQITSRGQHWRTVKLKKEVLLMMLAQHSRRSEPLPGRPQVLAIRFSSSASDDSANGAKIAIDRLTVKRGGLGFIVDDSLKWCQQRSWWEPGPRGNGFVYIRVATGE